MAWRRANPERVSASRRKHYEANKDQILERSRQRYRDNPERAKANNQRWRAANPERAKETGHRYYERTKDRQIERARQKRQAGYKTPRQRAHAEVVARLWRDQGGCCYLCGNALPISDAVLEHDHRCCPDNTYCSNCARGAACTPCNQAIGLLRDDPDLIERVAANLRRKMAEIDKAIGAQAAH